MPTPIELVLSSLILMAAASRVIRHSKPVRSRYRRMFVPQRAEIEVGPPPFEIVRNSVSAAVRTGAVILLLVAVLAGVILWLIS